MGSTQKEKNQQNVSRRWEQASLSKQAQQRVGVGHRLHVGVGHSFIGCVLWREVAPCEGDEGPLVTHSVAVVWGAEDSDALPVMGHFVPIVLDLMTPDDVVQAV